MTTLLAASDLTRRSDRAVAQAAHLAARLDARLVVVHVVDDELPAPIFETECGLALRALEQTTARLGLLPADRIAVQVVGGLDFRAILTAAQDRAADLIVLGAHRRAILQDVLIGTTVERVIRNAAIPVLVVKRPAPGDYVSTLAALDLTEEAAAVLRLASRLAGEQTLYAMHVLDDAAEPWMGAAEMGAGNGDRMRRAIGEDCEGALRKIARMADLPSGAWLPIIEWGSPAAAILRAAEMFGVSLAVVGTRTAAKSSMDRLLLGSVAERLLLDLTCDVLAVPLPTTTPLPGADAMP